MTYSLILLVCIIGRPVDCETRSHVVTGLSHDKGIAMLQVLTELEQWVDDHPAEELKAWRLLSLADT